MPVKTSVRALSLVLLFWGALCNTSFSLPLENSIALEKNPFFLRPQTFSFTVPANVVPSVKVTIWGYDGSPKNRGIRKTNNCSIFPIKGKAAGDFGARMTDTLRLTELPLKWTNAGGKSQGKQRRILSPGIKLGGTVKFTLTRGTDTYVTELIVPSELECPFDYNDYKENPLAKMVEGLTFTLSDQELRSRKVFNKKLKTYISTTEWKVNGNSFDEAFARKTMPGNSFQDCGTSSASAPSEPVSAVQAGVQAADVNHSKPGQGKGRFILDAQGIITDSATKLQWIEAPDKEITWDQTQTWISGLSNGWRTPTRAELAKLYIPESTRVNRLDPIFRSVRMVWAEIQVDDSYRAWTFYFDAGNEGWHYRDSTYMSLRAFAVRAPGNTSPVPSNGRFTRSPDGVITDSATKLQWLESPDKEISWDQTQIWISGLGNGWRTPTCAELAKLYISESTQVNRLDPIFRPVRIVWADIQAENSYKAWTFYFDVGKEGCCYRDRTFHSLRGLAVRSRT